MVSPYGKIEELTDGECLVDLGKTSQGRIGLYQRIIIKK